MVHASDGAPLGKWVPIPDHICKDVPTKYGEWERVIECDEVNRFIRGGKT